MQEGMEDVMGETRAGCTITQSRKVRLRGECRSCCREERGRSAYARTQPLLPAALTYRLGGRGR